MKPRLLLAVVIAGCAGAEAMPAPQAPAASAAPERQLGLFPGETMAFEVQLAGVLVGEAQLAVGEIGVTDGRRAVVVRSRAATAGAAALVRNIVDEATSLIDADTGRPITVETHVVMGERTIDANAAFTATDATVTYRRSAEAAPHTMKVAFGAHALLDPHTAMAQLRGWKAAPGATRSVFVIGGRRLWRIDLTYVGEDTIGSPVLGNRRAVVFEGMGYRARRDLEVEANKPSRTFRVWLSDDADRVPLQVKAKTELGDVVMSLTDYARP